MAHSRKLFVFLALLAAGCEEHAHHSSHHESARLDRPAPVYHGERIDRSEESAAETPVIAGHPRLFVRGQFTPMAPGDPQVTLWQNALLARANDLMSKPLVAYDPKHLLSASREALQRLTLLGGVYQLTHDPRYGDRARRELMNVATFPDWQPNDFLATAEMMNAVAIGYDWTFNALPPEDRQTVVTAIVEKGLDPAMKAYASQGGWTAAHHNWNLVCNGGVIVASLAVAEERPDIARRTLNLALVSIQTGLGIYDEAGATPESPMYNNYAMRYLTFAAAALETAPQTPISLARSLPNWTRAGDYRIEISGPGDKVFNYGDGSEIVGNSAWMFWHAAHFRRPEYSSFELTIDKDAPSIFDLLWYVPGDPTRLPPTQAEFEPAIVMRQRWNDPTSTFLALRKGSNADNHNHLDLGTFVLDMEGERFAQDLGADNYDMPGYLTNRKAEYLRSSTPGHNTLTIGNSSQPPTASATGELFPESAGKHVARIDMTSAYPGARSVIRTAGIDASGNVSISDEVRLVYPGPITWNLHTPAVVTETPDGGAILTENGKRVELRVRQPMGARIVATADETEPPALPITNSTHLRIICPAASDTRIQVEFVKVP